MYALLFLAAIWMYNSNYITAYDFKSEILGYVQDNVVNF